MKRPPLSRFPERPRRRAFDAWFTFCAGAVLLILLGTAYLLVTIGSDPASVGRLLGSVSQGFNERRARP